MESHISVISFYLLYFCDILSETKSVQCIQYQMTTSVYTIDDSSCTNRIANVQHFYIFTCKSFLHFFPNGRISFHTQTYKAIVERQCFFFAIIFHFKGISIHLCQCCIYHFVNMVFFHAFIHAGCGRCVQTIADGPHHFYDGHFCAARCEEFHNVQTNSATADNGHFLPVRSSG